MWDRRIGAHTVYTNRGDSKYFRRFRLCGYVRISINERIICSGHSSTTLSGARGCVDLIKNCHLQRAHTLFSVLLSWKGFYWDCTNKYRVASSCLLSAISLLFYPSLRGRLHRSRGEAETLCFGIKYQCVVGLEHRKEPCRTNTRFLHQLASGYTGGIVKKQLKDCMNWDRWTLLLCPINSIGYPTLGINQFSFDKLFHRDGLVCDSVQIVNMCPNLGEQLLFHGGHKLGKILFRKGRILCFQLQCE